MRYNTGKGGITMQIVFEAEQPRSAAYGGETRVGVAELEEVVTEAHHAGKQ